jgi:hypothetical protein
MRRQYENHYRGSTVPVQFRDDLNFLVGGYGRDDALPSLYRIKVKENTITADWKTGQSGVSWDGQSDSIERLIMGYDGTLKNGIESYVSKAFSDHHQTMTDAVARIVNEVLAKVGQPMPAGIDMALPASAKLTLPWDKAELPISFSNLPTQSAVRFVAFLVNLQAGRSKYSAGVATVGGFTHIGVVTKAKGFEMLEEPTLKHTDKGFGDDF